MAKPTGRFYATTMEVGILTIFRNGTFTSFTSDQVPGHYINRVERDSTGELRFLVEDEDRTSKSWYRLTEGNFEFIETQPAAATEIIFNGSNGTRWTITTAGITETKDGRAKLIPLDLTVVPQKDKPIRGP